MRAICRTGHNHRCYSICLGLLPSSEGAWALATQLLKNVGGILHVHANILDDRYEEFASTLCSSIKIHLAEYKAGSDYSVYCSHIERVKAYAPHVDHIVADILIRKEGSDIDSNGLIHEI